MRSFYNQRRADSGGVPRFRLGKLRGICPQCGRRTFKAYVDTLDQSKPLDASSCGRCNREIKCGYHLPPSRWFAANPAALADGFRRVTTAPRQPPPRPDFMPRPLMTATLKAYGRNPLVCFLRSRFDPAAVDAVVADYRVGTASRFGGSTVFWQIDTEGRVRTGKVMAYDPVSGRRVKGRPAVDWVHRLTGPADYRLEQTFFGAHLLAERPGLPVFVVESEKTALIMAICAREEGMACNVLATGGSCGLNLDPLRRSEPAYKGNELWGVRELTLIPDADMWERWSVADLKPYVREWRLIKPSSIGLHGSQDIGDLLLQ